MTCSLASSISRLCFVSRWQWPRSLEVEHLAVILASGLVGQLARFSLFPLNAQ
jgi:hypothetical protein